MHRLRPWPLVLLLACGPTESPQDTATAAGDAPSSATPAHLSGRADFEPAAGSLEADLTLELDPGAAEELAFLLNGALDLREVSGDVVLGWDVGPMAPGADWNRIVVGLSPEPEPGRTRLRFRYAGAPPVPESRINQITPEWVELSVDSAWHPVTETLDQESTLDLEIGLPTDWTVVTPGEAQPMDDGFRLRNEEPHADVVFVAAPALDVAEGRGARVYHRGAPEATTTAVLDAASTCRDVLDRRFGEAKRLPDVKLVIPDREASGYARKTFVALTAVDDQNRTNLVGFLCHELAHYWSSGALPLTVDNWLNEGFAVLVAAQAVRELIGEAAWTETVDGWRRRAAGQPSIWTPDDPQRRPFEVNYKKAPLALARLETEIGPEAFDRLVVRYMTDPIDDTPALLAALEEEAGAEARGWFERVLAEDDSDAPTAD